MKVCYFLSIFFTISVANLVAQINDPIIDFKSKDFDFKGNVISVRITEFEAKNLFGDMKMVGQSYEFSEVYFNTLNNPDSSYWGENDSSEIVQSGNSVVTYSKINNTEKITKLIERKMYPDLKRVKLSLYDYDLKGNVTTRQVFENDILTEKNIAKFNAKSKLVEYVEYSESGKLSLKLQNKYGANGKLADRIYSTSSGYYSHTKYKYSKGKLEKEYLYQPNGGLIGKTTYKYNSLNQLIEEKFSSINYADHNAKTIFKYNATGKVISEIVYYENGLQYSRNSYVYDVQGRLIEQEGPNSKNVYVFNALGQLLEETNFYFDNQEESGEKTIRGISKEEYAYDTNGNWIEKISSFTEKNKIFPDIYTVKKREINYRE